MDDLSATSDPGGHAQRASEIARLERLARWLDDVFRVPGTQMRFGIEALFGLIPVVGDGLFLLPAVYIVCAAGRLGVPWHIRAVMLANVVIDAAIGAIPVIGDLIDFGLKANRRNITLIKAHAPLGTGSGPPDRPVGDPASDSGPAANGVASGRRSRRIRGGSG